MTRMAQRTSTVRKQADLAMPPDDSVDDVVLIVGGGSGIGHALVGHYAERGITTVVWDIAGPRDVECDITEPHAITAAMQSTIRDFGVPTRTCITAGMNRTTPLLEEDAQSWDHLLAVNARGPALVMQAVAQALIQRRRGGSIVVATSISAELPDRSLAWYCASYAALNMTVRVGAAEWARHRIRVNAVAPGPTRTPMLDQSCLEPWLYDVARRTPMNRIGTTADVAEAMVALHDLGWVTGQILTCDGGLSLCSPIDLANAGTRRQWGNVR